MKRAFTVFLGIVFGCSLLYSTAISEVKTAEQNPLTPVSQLVDGDGNVIFNDAIVEKAIRETLGISEGPISSKRLSRLGSNGEELNISSPTLATADLSVLQLCVRLKNLSLNFVTPTNLGAITSLKNLAFFQANTIKIKDLNFLSGIKSISDIQLHNCPLVDISAVKDMPDLINFGIDTKLNDITPLYSCQKLCAVALAFASDADVNTLLDHLGSKVTSLGLLRCSIVDETLARIATLKLRWISLDTISAIHSLSPLWRIKTLRTLNLFGLRIDSLEGIQGLSNLVSARFQEIKALSDYSPLFQVTGLQTLNFVNMKAPNLQGIESLKHLRELSLEAMQGEVDLAPVFTLAKLKRLSMNIITVQTLAGIGGLSALTDLELYRLKGTKDFSPLVDLPSIKHINTDIPDKLPSGLPVNQ